jgi:polyisoprenoid-binding protein YceI
MMLLRSFIPPLGMMLLAAGQAGAQGVLIEKSEIRFAFRKMGVGLSGRFRRWKANIVFLPRDLAHSKVEIDIDLSSLDVANDEFEGELKQPAWLDVERHPVARFVSTSIKHQGGNRYQVTGTLSLKGITREITVPMTLRKDASGNNVAEGSFALNRLEHKLGEGASIDSRALPAEVNVQLRVVLPAVR